MSDCGRCTGHCCERFTLPYSMEQLRALAGAKREALSSEACVDPENARDVIKIAEMVVPLGEALTHADGSPVLPTDRYKWDYTCKNLDPTTRDCGIYETRPSMCRTFPDGRPCPYKGCTAPPTPPAAPEPDAVKAAYKRKVSK